MRQVGCSDAPNARSSMRRQPWQVWKLHANSVDWTTAHAKRATFSRLEYGLGSAITGISPFTT
jgi:hypothetical protein